VVPEQLTAGLGRLVRAEPSEPEVAAPEVERIARMEQDLADLRKKMGNQSRTITNLRKKLENR
jgi:hypothetical protein